MLQNLFLNPEQIFIDSNPHTNECSGAKCVLLVRLELDTIHVIPEAINVNHLISLRVLHKFYQMVLSEYFILCILLMISLLSPSKPLCPIWSLMEGSRAKITRHLDLYPNTIELHLEPQRVSQGYYWLPGFLENT